MIKITAIGVDLAKAVFQMHSVPELDKVVVRRQLKCKDLTADRLLVISHN